MGFDDFVISADRLHRETGWRRGQAMFNLLYDIHPGLADSIRGEHHEGRDTFYRDENIPRFLVWLSAVWPGDRSDG